MFIATPAGEGEHYKLLSGEQLNLLHLDSTHFISDQKQTEHFWPVQGGGF